MTPQGYVSVEDAAKQLAVAQAELTAASDAAQIPRFQFRGQLVYRSADMEKLRALPVARKAGAGVGAGASAAAKAAAAAELGDFDSDSPIGDTMAEDELDSIFGDKSAGGTSGVFDPDNPAALLMKEDEESGKTPVLRTLKLAGPPGSKAAATADANRPVSNAAPAERVDENDDGLLDARHRLFTDPDLVAQSKGVTFAPGCPVKFPGNPVIIPDRPWEEDGLCTLGGSVIHDRDEGVFKMWYYAVNKVGRTACYAVSRDGLKWDKPEVGPVLWEGKGTNVVMAHPVIDGFAELVGVVKDPDDRPERRYKAVYLSQAQTTGARTLRPAISSDGIIWIMIPGQVGTMSDVGHFVRDDATGKYVVYGRTVKNGKRAVARIESRDFNTWSAEDVVLAPDDDDPDGDDIYSLDAFPYGHGWVGLVQMFHGAPNYSLDLQLATSRRGMTWKRFGKRETFLGHGRIGDWDRYQLGTGGRPVVRDGRELWIYYGCRLYRHAPYLGADKGPGWGGIGVARCRIDDFAHAQASFDGGTLVTRPLVLKGPQLHVNVSAAFGVVGVSLMDADSKPIAGMAAMPIAADGTDVPVTWQGGASLVPYVGQTVRLAFALRNAKLYSFWAV